jgi:hypothetical protein
MTDADEILEGLARYSSDPYGFALWGFPWVSGNGVGKSAIVSIIILWAVTPSRIQRCCHREHGNPAQDQDLGGTRQVVPYVHRRRTYFAYGHRLFSRDPDRERTWRIDMVPWSEHNIVAFQGLHNEGKRLLIVFDEAAVIPMASTRPPTVA